MFSRRGSGCRRGSVSACGSLLFNRSMSVLLRLTLGFRLRKGGLQVCIAAVDIVVVMHTAVRVRPGGEIGEIDGNVARNLLALAVAGRDALIDVTHIPAEQGRGHFAGMLQPHAAMAE